MSRAFSLRNLLLLLALAALVLVALWLLLGRKRTVLPPPPSVHLLLGNPSQATAEARNVNNYLMIKPQYAISYNATKGIPNWVSWQLNRSWLGTSDRQNDFRPDGSLPPGYARITPTDYTGSGYDRGHQCPSADRTRSVLDNSATFLMTNMVPQVPDLNRGPWEKLESYSRTLVDEGKELYIIAGVAGTQGTIGGQVSVPASNWKVIVVLDRPEQGLAGVNKNTRVIAALMPNQAGIKRSSWRRFRVSVDQIEKETGYDLLSSVPEAVQVMLESQLDRSR